MPDKEVMTINRKQLIFLCVAIWQKINNACFSIIKRHIAKRMSLNDNTKSLMQLTVVQCFCRHPADVYKHTYLTGPIDVTTHTNNQYHPFKWLS